jgi:hypothetical protein
VLADDAADDEESEAGAGAAGGGKGLEEFAHLLGADAFTSVGKADAHFKVGEGAADGEYAAIRHGLASIADEVVKGLFDLIGVERHGGHVGAEIELDGDLGAVGFGFEEAEGFIQQLLNLSALELRLCGADGGKKLLDDGVETADLTRGDVEVLAHRITFAAHFFEAALEELQMNGE